MKLTAVSMNSKGVSSYQSGNSIQNQNNNQKQVNFGCRYCRLMQDVLATKGFNRGTVGEILARVIPTSISSRSAALLREIDVTPEKLHMMRANTLYDGINEGADVSGLSPRGLENSLRIHRELFDNQMALETGNDFNIYL